MLLSVLTESAEEGLPSLSMLLLLQSIIIIRFNALTVLALLNKNLIKSFPASRGNPIVNYMTILRESELRNNLQLKYDYFL